MCWVQHSQYFEALDDFWNPCTILFEHILLFIAECRSRGEEVILYTDANENVYSGRLGEALAGPDFNMKEQFCEVNGSPAPASHSDDV